MDEPERQSELFGVALAAVVAIVVTDGPFSLFGTIAGVVLLSFLHTHELERHVDSERKAIAFSTVWALCFLLVIGPIVSISPRIVLRITTVQDAQNPFNTQDAIAVAIWLVAAIWRYRWLRSKQIV